MFLNLSEYRICDIRMWSDDIGEEGSTRDSWVADFAIIGRALTHISLSTISQYQLKLYTINNDQKKVINFLLVCTLLFFFYLFLKIEKLICIIISNKQTRKSNLDILLIFPIYSIVIQNLKKTKSLVKYFIYKTPAS